MFLSLHFLSDQMSTCRPGYIPLGQHVHRSEICEPLCQDLAFGIVQQKRCLCYARTACEVHGPVEVRPETVLLLATLHTSSSPYVAVPYHGWSGSMLVSRSSACQQCTTALATFHVLLTSCNSCLPSSSPWRTQKAPQDSRASHFRMHSAFRHARTGAGSLWHAL